MSKTGINEVKNFHLNSTIGSILCSNIFSRPKNEITTRAIKMVNRIKFSVTGHVSTLSHFGFRATGHNDMQKGPETQICDQRRVKPGRCFVRAV
jgi:hypothetical protein